jgi:hypothetical protein
MRRAGNYFQDIVRTLEWIDSSKLSSGQKLGIDIPLFYLIYCYYCVIQFQDLRVIGKCWILILFKYPFLCVLTTLMVLYIYILFWDSLLCKMQTKKILPEFFELCPDAETCMQVPREQIQEVIRSLGLHAKRSRMLQRLSEEYLAETWTYVTDLHSVGRYVLFY